MEEILESYRLCRKIFNNVYQAALENQGDTDKPEACKFLADAFPEIIYPVLRQEAEKNSVSEAEFAESYEALKNTRKPLLGAANTFVILENLAKGSFIPYEALFECAKTDVSMAVKLAYLIRRELDFALNYVEYGQFYYDYKSGYYDLVFKAALGQLLTAKDDWGRELLPGESVYDKYDESKYYDEKWGNLKQTKNLAITFGIIGASVSFGLFDVTQSLGGVVGFGVGGMVLGAGLGILLLRRRAKNKAERTKAVTQRNEEKLEKASKELKEKLSFGFFEKVYEMKDELLQTMQIYSDICAKLLSHSAFSAIPKQYLGDVQALESFVEYFEDGRVDTLKEAINLYVAEMRERERHEEMQQLERERIENEKRAQEALLRIEQAKQKEISQLRASVKQYAEEREKADRERKEELGALKSELEKSNEELKRTNDEKTKMREELEKVNKALDL